MVEGEGQRSTYVVGSQFLICPLGNTLDFHVRRLGTITQSGDSVVHALTLNSNAPVQSPVRIAS